jgi:transcriptional regulator with XRE-family HTH domain
MENDDSDPSLHEAGENHAGKYERIGEILRREREKRQITVETIAAKLRLNAKYIEALEENHYDRLPGDTYVRVYLRSLAQYLSLDSEDLFRRFFDERGVTGADTLRKDSATKINLPALENPKKNGPTILFVIVLLVVLAGLGFVARKHGWLFSHSPKTAVAAIDSTGRGVAAAVTAADSIRVADSIAAVAAPRPVAANDSDALHPPAAPASGPMKLLITVRTDSSRVRVFSDGKEWRRMVRHGAWKSFVAQDSFNVCVSASDAVEISLNDKPIPLPAKSGVSAIKIVRGGVIWWTREKWDANYR